MSREEEDKILTKTKETLTTQKEEIDGLLKQVAELERYSFCLMHTYCYVKSIKRSKY